MSSLYHARGKMRHNDFWAQQERAVEGHQNRAEPQGTLGGSGLERSDAVSLGTESQSTSFVGPPAGRGSSADAKRQPNGPAVFGQLGRVTMGVV